MLAVEGVGKLLLSAGRSLASGNVLLVSLTAPGFRQRFRFLYSWWLRKHCRSNCLARCKGLLPFWLSKNLPVLELGYQIVCDGEYMLLLLKSWRYRSSSLLLFYCLLLSLLLSSQPWLWQTTQQFLHRKNIKAYCKQGSYLWKWNTQCVSGWLLPSSLFKIYFLFWIYPGCQKVTQTQTCLPKYRMTLSTWPHSRVWNLAYATICSTETVRKSWK